MIANDFSAIKAKMNPEVYLAPIKKPEDKPTNPFLELSQVEKRHMKDWFTHIENSYTKKLCSIKLETAYKTAWFQQALKWSKEL